VGVVDEDVVDVVLCEAKRINTTARQCAHGNSQLTKDGRLATVQQHVSNYNHGPIKRPSPSNVAMENLLDNGEISARNDD
jgi:hypothetical protein